MFSLVALWGDTSCWAEIYTITDRETMADAGFFKVFSLSTDMHAENKNALNVLNDRSRFFRNCAVKKVLPLEKISNPTIYLPIMSNPSPPKWPSTSLFDNVFI